jgi:hypothetical protein
LTERGLGGEVAVREDVTRAAQDVPSAASHKALQQAVERARREGSTPGVIFGWLALLMR